MTVIAVRDGIVAADSVVSHTGFGMVYGNVDKIKDINGWIVGASGSLAQTQQFFRWMAGSREAPVWERFMGIVLRPDGQVLEFDGSHKPMRINTPCGAAIGSGSNTAIAAMMAGANAIRAVEITTQLDCECGGPVKYLTLKNK